MRETSTVRQPARGCAARASPTRVRGQWSRCRQTRGALRARQDRLDAAAAAAIPASGRARGSRWSAPANAFRDSSSENEATPGYHDDSRNATAVFPPNIRRGVTQLVISAAGPLCPRVGDQAEDRSVGILSRHPDDVPACLGHCAYSSEVFRESLWSSMMTSFVLDGHLQIAPRHVDLADERAVLVVDRDLRVWTRIAGANDQKPQPCLAG